jgi:hypothetical protein
VTGGVAAELTVAPEPHHSARCSGLVSGRVNLAFGGSSVATKNRNNDSLMAFLGVTADAKEDVQ